MTEGPYWESDSASGFYRSAILSSIDGTNTQTGVSLVLTIHVYDRDNSCTAMQNVQVDILHCNAAGIYSDIQSSTNGVGVDYTSQNWLRGYQLTDTSGKVEFSTIVPGGMKGGYPLPHALQIDVRLVRGWQHQYDAAVLRSDIYRQSGHHGVIVLE